MEGIRHGGNTLYGYAVMNGENQKHYCLMATAK